MTCRNCGYELNENDLYCPNCGISKQEAEHTPEAKVETRGMGWFKFLIYFTLFASAVLNIISGFAQLTGYLYAGEAELVYSVFPAMRPVDIIVGLLTVALGVLALYTRFRLSGFRQNGPICLHVLYACSLIVSLVYVVASTMIVGQNVADSSTVAQLITSVGMLCWNIKYFKDRDDMFVN